MKDLVPVLVALIAGSVAMAGYVVNGTLARRAEKRRAYAEAWQCFEQYVQLPYTFHRRVSNDPETLSELGDLLARTHMELAFHKRWMLLDNRRVGQAFEAMVSKADKTNTKHRVAALQRSPSLDPLDIEVSHGEYSSETQEERELCIEMMRRHFSIGYRLRCCCWLLLGPVLRPIGRALSTSWRSLCARRGARLLSGIARDRTSA